MNFRDLLTVEERLAIHGLIDAHRDLEDAKWQLRKAKSIYGKSAEYLTKIKMEAYERYCETEDPKQLAIPEQFAIEVNGRCWLVTIDVDGDHQHEVREIGAIGKL